MTTENETKKPKTAKEFYALNFPPVAPDKADLKHAIHQVSLSGAYPVDGVYRPSKLDDALTNMSKNGERVLSIVRRGTSHFDVKVMVQK